MYSTLRTTVLTCAAAAGTGLIWLADAQKVADGGISLLHEGSGGKGPWGLAKSDFDDLLRYPNATGSFPIPGPGIEFPTTDSNISGDWSWSISVVADLPIVAPSEDNGDFYTGGKLVFNTPFSTSNTSSTSNDAIDDDWSVCLYDWSLWSTAYPDALRSDNGTCLSVLSSECIAAIEREASSKHKSERCSCPTASELPECAALGDDNALWSTTCGAAFRNASAIRSWGRDGLEHTIFGGGYGHDRGNITAYNYIGSLAWPVMASFRSNKIGGSITAKLSCPRADTATEGSVAPTDDGLDTGDGQEGDDGDGQSDQEDGGSQANANWLVLGGLLLVTTLLV